MRLYHVIVFVVFATFCCAVRAADDFAAAVDLSPLRTVAVQHRQTVKTLDSYARQGRLLNETNDTITVLQAKLGRLMPEAEPQVLEHIAPANVAEAEQWQG